MKSDKNHLNLFEKKDTKIGIFERSYTSFLAIILGIVSVFISLSIGFFAYKYTLKTTEERYHKFYMNKAKMLASIADSHKDATKDILLNIIETCWIASGDKPPDEYICAVDKDANLILHTAHPDTIGKYVGNNVALDNQGKPSCRLREIVQSQVDYVGNYISSSGQSQIAAFAAIPQRQWILGIHRSKDALIKGIKDDVFFFALGYIIVCGFFLPVSLVLLYATLKASNRKRMNVEGKLNISERKSRTWLECSPVCTKIVDLDFNLQYMSAAGIEGLKIDDITQFYGKPYPFDFYPESFRNVMTNSLKKVKETGEIITQEASAVDIEGNELWFHSTLVPVNDDEGRIDYIIVVSIDITERKQAEKLIETSRDYLQKLNDSLGAVIFTVKIPERVVEYVNCTVESVFGYKPDECIGKKTKMLYSAIEEYHGFGRSLERAIKEGRKELKEEGLFKRKNGETFPCEVTTTFLRENEKIVRVISILHDITDRKRMEEELIKMQKLESVGLLAGGIAHDFNNSLQAILSTISVAKLYVNPEDEVYDRLTDAEKITLQSKSLPQQLLTFSRGGQPIMKVVSAPELIKDSANFALSGSNVRCELDLPDCSCLVEVDKGQINQVFSNLLINADQAMPMGGTIKVSAIHCNVGKKDLLPLQEGRYVKITIEDPGTGIAQEHLQKIFDPYFTTKETGSGLGLAITYSIIKKHGGHITVESEIGVGTTFYFYLPASQKEIPKEHVEGEADKKNIEKITSLDERRILFMEDETIISLAVARQLRNLNYEVETARDGFEAIELYQRAMESSKPFNVVILDLTIPGGMGGAETIKKLLEIDHNVKAVVASGYANDPLMANFKESGFRGVVEKPFEIEKLEEVLQKVIMEKET